MLSLSLSLFLSLSLSLSLSWIHDQFRKYNEVRKLERQQKFKSTLTYSIKNSIMVKHKKESIKYKK